VNGAYPTTLGCVSVEVTGPVFPQPVELPIALVSFGQINAQVSAFFHHRDLDQHCRPGSHYVHHGGGSQPGAGSVTSEPRRCGFALCHRIRCDRPPVAAGALATGIATLTNTIARNDRRRHTRVLGRLVRCLSPGSISGLYQRALSIRCANSGRNGGRRSSGDDLRRRRPNAIGRHYSCSVAERIPGCCTITI